MKWDIPEETKIMYGLPDSFDLSFFLDASLQQVCTGLHEVVLNFSKDVSVHIESQFRFTDSAKNESTFDSSIAGTPLLLTLLSQSIHAASGTNGVLKLSFESGSTLEVFDSSEHYESYQIRNGAHQLVV